MLVIGVAGTELTPQERDWLRHDACAGVILFKRNFASKAQVAELSAAIREIDAKGRHTTAHREIHFSDLGACVLDTPGMREIQLADTGAGLIALFADLEELATQCKFRDCRHEREPDCAVQAAVARGEIALERLARWRKLAEEDRANTEAMAVKKAPRRAETKSPRPRPKAPQVSDYDDD